MSFGYDDLIRMIGHKLLGTCDSIDIVLERIDPDFLLFHMENVEDSLLDHNIERCKGCGWWFESCMLESENEEECGKCEDCRISGELK